MYVHIEDTTLIMSASPPFRLLGNENENENSFLCETNRGRFTGADTTADSAGAWCAASAAPRRSTARGRAIPAGAAPTR